MNFFVTGSNGFVGRILCTALKKKYQVVEAIRSLDGSSKDNWIPIGEINNRTSWDGILQNIDVVIHLAARVHVMNDKRGDSLKEFREINSLGTARLARQAAAQGVRKFVYISSVKVNGEGGNSIYSENNSPNPLDDYGISKREAEDGLREVAEHSGMEMVIIRPPLVYGAGVKANFLRLLKLVSTGIPLPFGAINNKRSMIYVENLADGIITAACHPKATGETFLISDGHDLSIKELISTIAFFMEKKVLLLPVPPHYLEFFGGLAHRQTEIKRLTDSLQINIDKIQKTLAWKPPFEPAAGIQKTVNWYIKNH